MQQSSSTLSMKGELKITIVSLTILCVSMRSEIGLIDINVIQELRYAFTYTSYEVYGCKLSVCALVVL